MLTGHSFLSSFRALELDCLKNSHPIEVPVGHPSEIDEIFDDISYNKGASVIRMLHKYIGDDDFRKGMNIYLTRHQVNIIYLHSYNLFISKQIVLRKSEQCIVIL